MHSYMKMNAPPPPGRSAACYIGLDRMTVSARKEGGKEWKTDYASTYLLRYVANQVRALSLCVCPFYLPACLLPIDEPTSSALGCIRIRYEGG